MKTTCIMSGPRCSIRTALFLLLLSTLGGQTPPPSAAAESSEHDEIVVLSPFVVSSEEDTDRYQARSTLAGTRVRTELKDVASSLSVVTSQFLRDTGATNNQTLLQYTPNTEIGGVYGNFGGVGNTYVNGAGEPSSLRPSTNTRVRGLDSADNTRDYFLTDIPWDSFNVDRIDLQRGPNSILFGIGSPAGIINASVNTATYKDAVKIQNRFSSFGSVRNSLDVNQVLIKNQLAIRVAALDDRTKYRQEPAFNDDKRLFGAARWDPDLFRSTSAHTTIRANYEHGEVKANRPYVTPPGDNITPFFTALNRTTYDPAYVWSAGIIPQGTGATVPISTESLNPWLSQGIPGVTARNGPMFFYNRDSGAALGAIASVPPGGTGDPTHFALGPSGATDGVISGLVFSPWFGITGFNGYSITNNLYFPNDPSTLGASSGFYKSRSLSDTSIFDFYNHLLTGPDRKQWQNWDTYNIALEQTFLNNRLGLEFVYDYQDYNDGQEGIFGNFISVDVAANYTGIWPYQTGVTKYNGSGAPGTNPNAGRAFTAGNGTGGSNNINRENIRITGFGELRASDFLTKSWLSDLLGRHTITGLYSRENYNAEGRGWELYGTDISWPAAVNSSGNDMNNGNRKLSMITYLSEPLFSKSLGADLGIKPVTAGVSVANSANLQYYDSHWKWPLDPADPNYVDPAAPFTNPQYLSDNNNSQGLNLTQSENPANYVGWKSGSFGILSARDGDIDSLYTSGSKVRKITESKAATWQGYLWDDTLIGTFGWRRDTQRQRSGSASVSSVTGAASMNYDLLPLDPTTGVAKGISRSWGLVLHEPKAFRDKLPWGTDVSLAYNVGRNTRVENRYGFDGGALPQAAGETKDFSVAINTLHDRLRLKVTWYKTTVKDANMTSNAAASVLGGNAYYLYQMEMWGLAGALLNLSSYSGVVPDYAGYWDWVNADNGTAVVHDPTSAAYQNDPSTIKQKAAVESFLAQMQPQSWWDAYGYGVNVAKAKAGDWNNAIAGWTPLSHVWGVSSGTNGRINGSLPTGTIDNQSKGVEIELAGEVVKNWNVSINASKQTAEQVALGSSLVDFIEDQYAKYQSPAGDLRLWWGTDMTLRQYYQANIYATYQFLAGGNGRMVPEMSPWRLNAVTNYAFDHGLLKGFNVGLGYRWQDGQILGYRLNSTYTNLDVDQPIWGKSTYAVDLWAGYERKLTRKINWRVQLNIRGVDSRAHLEPLSVQPDGSPALLRIVEGQTWMLTNTLSF